MIALLRRRLRAALERRLGLPTIPIALDRLKRLGFEPGLVFDVGAYRGDFARLALGLWPSATVACFEPLPHRVAELRAVAAAVDLSRIRVFPGLLGADERTAVVFHEVDSASSVLAERAGPAHPTTEHPMTTVDRVVADHFGGRAPDLIKLDVQGYELEVLKGAERSLPRVGAVLAEVNLLDIHEGVPLLAEVAAWLDARGFVAYDICGFWRRPLDGALWQADMIFVPDGSPLRRDKRWQVS